MFILVVNAAFLAFMAWTFLESNAALEECRRQTRDIGGLLGRQAARDLCEGIGGIGNEIRFTLILFQWALVDVVLLSVWRITVGRRVFG